MKRFAILVALSLAGCALFPLSTLKPGLSTEADVRASLGKPGHEWQEPGGMRGLAFPTGPLGTQTYVARIDSRGTLTEIEQVLDDAHIRRIRPGQSTGEDVLRLIGPPSRRVAFPNKGQTAWDYRIQDSWGYLANFSVMFDERGIAAETVTVRIENRSDR